MINDEIVLQYSKSNFLWIILIGFGLIISLGNVYYIIKYPHHAMGKENEAQKRIK